MPGGRPSLYEHMGGADVLCPRVIELAQDGKSEVELAVELGVARTTMRSWADQHEAFSSALSRAREISQAWWERAARTGMIGNNHGQINPAAWKHTVSCRFRDDYTERSEITGKDGAPLIPDITFRIVDASESGR